VLDVAGMVLLLLHALDCAHMAPDIAAGVASCTLSAWRVGTLAKQAPSWHASYPSFGCAWFQDTITSLL
jgi:hypothetical protein